MNATEPIVVEVRRGDVVEAVHLVHAVAVRGGEVVAGAGDPALVCFMRSSSKPLQALPLARARDDLSDDDLAIASASHRATEDQIAAVRALLAKAPATENDLELGLQEGRPPERIYHNCSGKHAGMLALCRAEDWETHGYRLPSHPVQRACADAHVEAAEVAFDAMPTATDGCGVVTFALSLEQMAHAYARLESLPADGVDFALMRAQPGWIAKGGAEGLLCAAGPGGIGVALKVEDGASRPQSPALAAFLGRLEIELPELAVVPLTNSRGDRVGELSVPNAKRSFTDPLQPD